MVSRRLTPLSIFRIMRQFFDADDWKYSLIEDQPAVQVGFQGESGVWRCVAQAREEQKQYIFYSILDEAVPEDGLSRAAEFVARANYGLVIGNFELDHSDGEVRFKTSVDFTEAPGAITPEVIGHYTYVNVLMMDRYYGALESVIAGTDSPEEAVAKVLARNAPSDS